MFVLSVVFLFVSLFLPHKRARTMLFHENDIQILISQYINKSQWLLHVYYLHCWSRFYIIFPFKLIFIVCSPRI